MGVSRKTAKAVCRDLKAFTPLSDQPPVCKRIPAHTRLAPRDVTVYCGRDQASPPHWDAFRDQHMPHTTKIAFAAIVALLAGLSNPAEARGRHYPLTRCGPDLASLCPIHGYFDGAPFHYHAA